ncbi:MAG TPA: hypothetical protein VKA78_07625 [Pyrinomonadaceae bacterium]|nr:hypothetical protein [Pyrinomonadaceae bacterium]
MWLAPADEVNNLDSVVVVEHSTAPFATTHYGTIKFDRDSRRGKIKLVD